MITFAADEKPMYEIRFHFETGPSEPVVLKKVKPGQTLLEVALAKGIDLRHNCGGMCTCSTCHLKIREGSEHLEAMGKKEKDFLRKANRPGLWSRLACQCLLLEGKGIVEVLVPDQRHLPLQQ